KLLRGDGTKSRLNADIAAGQPSKFFQLLPKRPDPRLHCRVVLDDIREYTDKRHALALLCPHFERPRRRAAEQRDELAARDHSITSSAAASSVVGTSRPSVLAVFRLITSSNLVDCITGRSAGFSPLRTRPA